MDCNSYSYMNMSGNDNVIMADKYITFEDCTNFFGDRFYYVYDLLGDFAEEYPHTLAGYKAAEAAFNNLVKG